MEPTSEVTEDMPAPSPEEMPRTIGPSMEDMESVLRRQGRVIMALKEQIGNVVLANIEQSVQIDMMREELAALQA